MNNEECTLYTVECTVKCSCAEKHWPIQLSFEREKDNGGEDTSALRRTAQLELLVAQLLVVVFQLLVLLADLRRERLLLLRRRARLLRRALVRRRRRLRRRSSRGLVVMLELFELQHNQSAF